MRRLLAPLLLLFVASVCEAQPRPPVSPTIQTSLDGQTLVVKVRLDRPYHAQANPAAEGFKATTITLQPAAGVMMGTPKYPPGVAMEYPALGILEVYEDEFEIRVPLTLASTHAGELRGTVLMQICDESSCFPAYPFPFTATLPGGSVTTAPGPTSLPTTIAATGSTGGSPAEITAGDDVQKLLSGGAATSDTLFGVRFTVDSLASAILAGLIAGMIFNVMPCVLPVLPLKAVGFYEAAAHNRAKTIAFGAAFTAGMVAVFVLLGLVVVFSKKLFGEQLSWGQHFSNPWVTWALVAFLIVLGAAMMGAFTFDLPTSIYGLDFRHDTIGGNVMWGGFTAVLSTPCTAPLFPALIGYAVSQTTLVAIVVMVSVGVGMGLPYLVLSMFPQAARKFPRTGPIAELVKQMMAFLLFGTAAFFAGGRLFGADGNLWLVFGVALWASLYLVVRTVQLMPGGTAVLISTAVAALMTGATLAIAIPPANSAQWVDYSPAVVEAARREGKTVLIDFTASWCVNCKAIERTVYTDRATLDALRDANVVLVRADVDKIGWDFHQKLAPGKGIPLTAIVSPRNPRPLLIQSTYSSRLLLEAIALSARR